MLLYQSDVVKESHAGFVGPQVGEIQQRVETKPGRIASSIAALYAISSSSDCQSLYLRPIYR